MTQEEVFEFYRRLCELDPEPKGELEWVNPYTLLVAVALSAQATDVSVNLATRELFKVADTPDKMLALGEDRLKSYIKTIGLFNTKAKNLILMAGQLMRDFGGQVPSTRHELERLAGVGRKTANVVLNTAFGEPVIAVDTHVFRVANRTGLAEGKDPLAVERTLEEVTPDLFRNHAHHWLILHGRYICKARLPECWRCPVVDLCRYTPKTTQLRRPISKPVQSADPAQ